MLPETKEEKRARTQCRDFFGKKGRCRWGDQCGYKHTEESEPEGETWEDYDPREWDAAGDREEDDAYYNFSMPSCSSASRAPDTSDNPWRRKAGRNRKRSSARTTSED